MDSVHVAIRVRPLIEREKQAEAETHWKADTHKITLVDYRGKNGKKEYVFDRVFDSSETTSDVYEEIAQPIVLEAMDGINGTIFAYGQTSSGKTYTMMGDRESPGIIPCAIQEIFDNIENTPNREFLLRVSYMELYNEAICDLLSSEKKNLQIRENDKTVFVHDLTEEVVTEVEDILDLLKKGEARRHFGQTDMNERSSRSHTIFRMIIESREIADRKKSIEKAVKVSHLNLVDLAGSERANETKAEGARLKEACRINQSLSVLALVINKLSQGAEFIPFRDSKLTRILQSSLGGNAKTAIICTVTPVSVDQTDSTLAFASRAKTIKNKPKVNEVLSDEAMMQRQRREIQELKRKILELEQQGELLEEKASLHEQQEQRIKILEKMILVSGGAGIPSIMESKAAKYKRRQTWCPGTGNPLPLLPLSKPAAPALTEEVSFVYTVSPSSVAKTAQSSSDTSGSPTGSVSPVASICSNDFSSSKQVEFMERMDQLQTMEDDSFLVPPLSPQRGRRKRRRAHVHFAMAETGTADAECQTEPPPSGTSVLSSSSNGTTGERAQEAEADLTELHNKIRTLESTIANLEEEKQRTEGLSQALDQSKKYSEVLQEQISELESTVSSMNETAATTGNLSEALQRSDNHCRELQKEVVLLQEKLASLEGDKAMASEALVHQESLEQDCMDLRKQKEELEKKIQSLEEENSMVSQLSDALCLSEEKVAELESQARDADCKVAASNDEIANLKAQLEQQEGLADSLHKSDQEILALKSQLEGQDHTLLAAAQQSEQEISHLQAALKELEETVASLSAEKEHLSTLPQCLEDKEKQLEELHQMICEAKDTISALRQEKVSMSEELEQQKTANNQTCVEASQSTAKIQDLEKTVQMRDEELEVVNQLLEEQRIELETLDQNLNKQRAEAETQEQGSAAKITTLSQQVEDLEKLLEEQSAELERLNSSHGQQQSEAESQDAASVAKIAALSQQVEELERKQAASAAGASVASSDEAQENAARFVEMKQEEAEEKMRELTRALRAREEEIETLNMFLEEQGKETEEARSQHRARIAELTAQLEEQQGQLALAGVPSQTSSETGVGLSLADELGAQEWRAKARRTESELLGSVQLCEDIMEEKMKLSNQLSQSQKECNSLREALRCKVEELTGLQELHEFTQMEATMTKEQEAQYQRDIEGLEQKLRDQQDALAAQYRQEAEELRKKLGTKDKVLEAQYQQDIDELLHKLREKNQKFDALQEENVGLIQALSQKEQMAERLQEQINGLEFTAEGGEDRAEKQLCVAEVQVDVERVDEGTQMELFESESLSSGVSCLLDEDTQVTSEDTHLPCKKAVSSPSRTLQDKMINTEPQDEEAFLPEALQQKIAELEAREATLRQECESLQATVSSRDQEIEVLNEILDEYGQEKDGDEDSASKITAFVQRIEQLEEQLQARSTAQGITEEPSSSQDLHENRSLAEENKSLSNALTDTENYCEELKAKVENLEELLRRGDKVDAELSCLREEIQVLSEKNLSLSENLILQQRNCKELEAKVHILENQEQQDSTQEAHQMIEVLQKQVQDVMLQKVELEQTVGELRSKITDLEDSSQRLSQENQMLLEKCRASEQDKVTDDVLSEKEALLEEQNALKQLLQESSSKAQELEAVLAALRNQSSEAAEIIKNRDDEIEMLRQVLGEQEEQLQGTRKDYSRSLSRVQELEHAVDAMNHKNTDRAVEIEEGQNEIRRLNSVLEQLEEQLQMKNCQNVESLSRIQDLESALAASNSKNLEKSQAEAEQHGEIERLQDLLEEQADQLRSKDEACTELEAKLKDSEQVIAATNSKSAELEAAKLKQEEEIQMLEHELDEMGDEFHEHKNNFADLQMSSREQQAKIKDLEGLLASRGQSTKELEAVISKQDEEIKVFRALLDQRNQNALEHEDRHHEMLTKIQNLETVNSDKAQMNGELEEAIRKRDEELQQLYTTLSSQERDFETRFSKLQAQLRSDRNSVSSQEQQIRELQEIVERRDKEILALQHQLEEYSHQKNGYLSEVSQREEEFCAMQNALQESQKKNDTSASEIKALEAQVHNLSTQLESGKASSDSSEEVAKLQEEKSRIQAELNKTSRKLQTKTKDLEQLANVYEDLQMTCSELEDEFEEEKAQHQETQKRMQETETSKARLEELERQNVEVEELTKTHKQKLAEKNLRINELETELLRGTEPLENRIRSLKSEVRYQETKAQQYKKEVEKLRSQTPQHAPSASDSASASSSEERAPEATGGSGIIESCAIFAIKAENHKLTKALEKTKRELEHKDLKYHDEVSKKTRAEQETQYWKEKARSLASHLKRAAPSQTTDSVTASPLKDRNTNDSISQHTLPKKTRPTGLAGTKYVEKIPRSSAVVGAPLQQDDRNWLSKAVAERDAAQAGSKDDDPQQCATQ